MEIAAIVERLDSIDRSLRRIEEYRLTEIQEHLRTLNGRMGSCEKWQSAADQILESMNERIDENSDRVEKNEGKMTSLWEWVNQQKGWSGGRTQMFVQIGAILTAVATLITILTKIH